MTLTPLEEMEDAAHEKFGLDTATKEEVGKYLTKAFPTMDGGVSVGIAVAGLIIQGWRAWEDHKKSKREPDAGGSRCPECSDEDIKRNKKAGKLVCEHGYKV
jgi:hypothetical protein